MFFTLINFLMNYNLTINTINILLKNNIQIIHLSITSNDKYSQAI